MKKDRVYMDIVIFIFVILLASILQTSTGFGFSILAIPFLLLLFEPKEAIQINIILSLFISISLLTTIKRDIDFGVIKRFVIGSAVGLPMGMMIFVFLDVEKLKFGISLIILLVMVMLILKLRIHQSKSRDLFVGGLSGSLTSSIGMPGPPLLLYFSGTETSKEKLRGTTLAYYLFIYSTALIMQIIFVGTNKKIWMASSFALPLVLVGLYLGQILFKRINQRTFRLFTYVILLFTGIYLLIASW